MFNWALFISLILLCIPGLLIAAVRVIGSLERTIEANLKPGQSAPSRRALQGISFLQNLVLVALAAAVGTALAPRVELSAPVLEGLLSSQEIAKGLPTVLLASLLLGLGGGLAFLAAYYWIARPRLDPASRGRVESLRMALGLSGRLLYGGIVEEVLTRWGLMTLLVGLGAWLLGGLSDLAYGIGILLAGLLFGLGHLPGVLAAGARRSGTLIALVLGLNLWAGLVFGLAYWQFGLEAAILAHMLFHLLWYPLDRRYTEADQKSGAS